MKRIFPLYILILSLLVSSGAKAQRWKRNRYEFSFGVGASNFLGDLGGANQIGTHYFKDFEFSMTRFAVSAGLRYKLSEYFALKSHLTYGKVAGDDKLTKEFFRNYRNLNFFSNIFELNMNFEAAFQEEQIGHQYRLRHVRGAKGYEIYTYGFVGAGLFYFNPKTTYNGHVEKLRPLGTEGQGHVSTRKEYSLLQFCIPIGLGVKYTIDRYWGLGFELGIRKTFTDYIDDVSTTYFDFYDYGYDFYSKEAMLSDRSLFDQYVSQGQDPIYLKSITAPSAERGDPRYKDSYMFAVFSVNYKITNLGRGRHRF